MSTLESHELAAHLKRTKKEYPYIPDNEIRPDVDHLLTLKVHWGLKWRDENILFYLLMVPALVLEIVAAGFGAYWRTSSHVFIACVTAFQVLHWAAWFQTAFCMAQRSSWRRDEETLEDRVQFLWYAVRLQRLMLVSNVSPYARVFALLTLFLSSPLQ